MYENIIATEIKNSIHGEFKTRGFVVKKICDRHGKDISWISWNPKSKLVRKDVNKYLMKPRSNTLLTSPENNLSLLRV